MKADSESTHKCVGLDFFNVWLIFYVLEFSDLAIILIREITEENIILPSSMIKLLLASKLFVLTL